MAVAYAFNKPQLVMKRVDGIFAFLEREVIIT